MIRLESHIENLLLRHDCVIVPGLGGFVTRFEEASFSDDGKEILPPYRSVSFNSQLRTNDGLLTQSYMNVCDTSFPKAQSLVEEDSNTIREELRKTGEYTFGSLGKLQLTQNNAVIFTPEDKDSGIYTKDLYGLSLCNLSKIAVEKTDEPTIDTIVAKPTTAPNSVVVGNNEKNMVPSDNQYVIRISKNAVHYTITTIAAALLYFVFTIAPSANPLNEKIQQASILSTGGVAEKQNVQTSAKPQSKQAIVQKRQGIELSKPASNDTNHESKTLEASLQGSYTLVLASAIAESGADAIINSLQASGFNGAMFVHDGKMTRVVYNSYPSQQEAANALHELKQKHERFAHAWVMKK